MPSSIVQTLRKVAVGGGGDNIYIHAPVLEGYSLRAIEVVNETRGDRVDAYIAQYIGSNQVSADACGLIPRVYTSGAVDSAVWSGIIPMQYPNAVVAEFLNAVAGDNLVLKVVFA